MKNYALTLWVLLLFHVTLFAQNTIKGSIIDHEFEQELSGVSIVIKGLDITTFSNPDGTFVLQNIPDGSRILVLSLDGYEVLQLLVKITQKVIDLGVIRMYKVTATDEDVTAILLSEEELADNEDSANYIAGLSGSYRDAFMKAAAFDWGASFFKLKGLDRQYHKVLINGIEMNKFYDGRPQWSNWGGLNDVLRNVEFSHGLAPSSSVFGGVIGTTNISTRASEYPKQTKISYASSNRSYLHRTIGTYTSGIMKNQWAVAISASKRWGNETYVAGTFYDANSLFLSVEKYLNKDQSINLTVFLSENNRGKSAALTEEVYELKGKRYNEYWGFQNGRKRNARVKRVFEPIFFLNHYWNVGADTRLNTCIAYQIGERGASNIMQSGGERLSPTYYKKMPSYWLDRGDVLKAYEFEKDFIKDGQLSWNRMYDSNRNTTLYGKPSPYLMYEDRNDDTSISYTTSINTKLNEHIVFSGNVGFTQLKSENFAEVIDMLGGEYYLDINSFAKINAPQRQNDLLNPNRKIKKGDRFKYNFGLEVQKYHAFFQTEHQYKKIDLFAAISLSNTKFQRTGYFKNGRFPENSFGKSKPRSFLNVNTKGGVTYKISGRQLLDFKLGYISNAPVTKNLFANIRVSNDLITKVSSEKLWSGETSYVYWGAHSNIRVTGYFLKRSNGTNIRSFFLQNTVLNSFIQELLTGIQQEHLGVEVGAEIELTPSFKLQGATNIGRYVYANNPTLTAISEDFVSEDNSSGIQKMGNSYLKGYRLASGPQKTYALGFEYRDPAYWFLSVSANYLDGIYVGVSPILRTTAFYKDYDGLPFNEYDPQVAKKLLVQEKIASYTIVNAVAGKSWKIGEIYIGTFLSVQNLFNETYKTGGFKQSRKGDYRQLLKEFNRDKKLFGTKYWYGRGATYFFNMNIKF